MGMPGFPLRFTGATFETSTIRSSDGDSRVLCSNTRSSQHRFCPKVDLNVKLLLDERNSLDVTIHEEEHG